MRSLGAGRAPRLRAAAGGALAAAVVGAAGLALTPPSSAGHGPAPQAARALPTGEGLDVAAPSDAPEPVSVALPRLGVHSVLDPLQLQPDGELQAPPRWDVAGWYVGGPRPGERGPAVVAGHVDGPDGPAVFWRLEELRPGDRVEVRRADGSTAVFAVTRSLVVPKDDFPTAEVYGPTPHAELRLITCDGAFDRGSGHYLDNLVVFATEVRT
jgi:hypothetical protein